MSEFFRNTFYINEGISLLVYSKLSIINIEKYYLIHVVVFSIHLL